MEVSITDQCRMNWIGRIAATDVEVIQAVREPDVEERIAFPDDCDLVLSVKKFPGFAILTRSNAVNDERKVEVAIKFFFDMDIDLDTARPVQVLRELATRFGVPVTACGRTSLFFENEVIRYSGNDPRLSAAMPFHQQVMFNGTIRRDDGPPQTFSFFFVFCLDALKYQEWVQSHSS